MQDQPPSQSFTKIGVMIVEDQTAMREMLALVVAHLPGFEMVAETGEVGEALRLVRERQPRIVVLDWLLQGGGTGLDFLRGLKDCPQPAKVLVFSATATEYVVREALTHGAKGFIEKSASVADFTVALRVVADGGVHFGPTVSETMQRLVRRPDRDEQNTVLTPRECEVLRHIAEGLGSREIAARLGLSVRTVDNHRANITDKTGLHSIAQLTLYAVQLGLISGAVNRGPVSRGQAPGPA
jgi:DNA-binding NarL/FixJ family response regulator